jgi:hypothetical protein
VRELHVAGRPGDEGSRTIELLLLPLRELENPSRSGHALWKRRSKCSRCFSECRNERLKRSWWRRWVVGNGKRSRRLRRNRWYCYEHWWSDSDRWHVWHCWSRCNVDFEARNDDNHHDGGCRKNRQRSNDDAPQDNRSRGNKQQPNGLNVVTCHDGVNWHSCIR